MTIRSFDDDARGMPAGWHAAQFRFGGPSGQARSMMHGMDGAEYSREYNHSSHLSDEIGVFRSDCPACQRHFREAFGSSVQELLTCLATDEDIYPYSEADAGETTRAHYLADADQLMHEGMNDQKALVVAASLLIRAARTLEIPK